MPMLPLAEAATHLGLTTEALRKRITRGSIVGRKRRGQWFVDVADLSGVASSVPDTEPEPGGQTAGQVSGSPEVQASGHAGVDMAGQASGTGQTAPLQTIARAQELAALTEAITGPWRRRLEEQAEEIGRLKAELDHARAQLAEATQVQDTPVPAAAPAPDQPAQEPRPRPWWRWLVWSTEPA